MNFQEADQRYQWYFNLYQSGKITFEQLKAETDKIQVIDSAGRTWMKQAGSGQWFVFVNNQWVAANPQPVETAVQPSIPVVQGDLPPKKRAGWVIPVLIALVAMCLVVGVVGGGIWAIQTNRLPWLKNIGENLPVVGNLNSSSDAKFIIESDVPLQAGDSLTIGADNMIVSMPDGSLSAETSAKVITSQMKGQLADAVNEFYQSEQSFYQIVAEQENDGTGDAQVRIPAQKEIGLLLEIFDEKYISVTELPLEDGYFKVNMPVESLSLDYQDESVSLKGSHYFTIVQLDAADLTFSGGHLASLNAAGDPRSCGVDTQIASYGYMARPVDKIVSYCRKNSAGTIHVMVFPEYTPGITNEKVDPVVDKIEKIMAFYQSKGFTAVNLSDGWLKRVQVVIEAGSGDPYYSSVNGVVHIPEDSLASSYGKNIEYELAHELAHWVQDEAYNFASSYWANKLGVSSEAKWWFEVSAENMVMLYNKDYIEHNLTTYGMTTPESHDTPFQYSPNLWNDQLYLHAQLVKVFMCGNEYACPFSLEGFVTAINNGEYPYHELALAKINENLSDYALYLLGKQVVSANSTIPISDAIKSGKGYGEFIVVKNKSDSEILYEKTGYPPQIEPTVIDGVSVVKINAPIQKLGVYPLTISSPADARQSGFPVEVVVESGVPFWYTLDEGKEQFHNGKTKITIGPIHSILGYKKLRLVAYAQDQARTFTAKVQPLDLQGDWLVFSTGLTGQNYSCDDPEDVETTINYEELAKFSAIYTSLLPTIAGIYNPDFGKQGYTWAAKPDADLTFGGKVALSLNGALLLRNDSIQLQSKLVIPNQKTTVPANDLLLSGVSWLSLLLMFILRKKNRAFLSLCVVVALIFMTGCAGFGGFYGTIATDTQFSAFEEVKDQTIQSIAQSANASTVSNEDDVGAISTNFTAAKPKYILKGNATADIDLHLLVSDNEADGESVCSGTVSYNVIAVFLEDGVITSLGK